MPQKGGNTLKMLNKIRNRWKQHTANKDRQKTDKLKMQAELRETAEIRTREHILLAYADELLNARRSGKMLQRLPLLLQASPNLMATIGDMPKRPEVVEDLDWKGINPYREGRHDTIGPRILADFTDASGERGIYEDATYIEEILLYAIHRVPTLISNPKQGLADLHRVLEKSEVAADAYNYDAGATHPVLKASHA